MLFDSWAGVLSPAQFRRYVIAPTRRIVAALHARHPGVPVIGFPRLAGVLLGEYAAATGVQGVGVDTGADPAIAARSCRRASRCRATSTRSRWSPAARRSRPETRTHPRRACAAARSSSTSATASCRRNPAGARRALVRRSARLDAARELATLHAYAADAPGHRAVQPRRPGHAGRGPAVPGQPVPRPGHPARAVLHPSAAGAHHRQRPRQARHRQLRDPRRRLAAAANSPRSRPAALEAALAGVRCPLLRRHALLAPVQRRRSPAPCGPGTPDEVVLLPLYPQYSTTTTGSSLTAWREAAAQAGLVKPATTLCCYHADPGFVAATAAHRAPRLRRRTRPTCCRRSRCASCSPPTACRRRSSSRATPTSSRSSAPSPRIVRALAIPGLDWSVCYQSRATPQKWLDPSTEHAIEHAAADQVAVLVVPIAFVSEHSETLVELDVEYREFAETQGVPGYFRAPAQNSDAGFIPASPLWCAAAAPAAPACAAGPAAAPAQPASRLSPCPRWRRRALCRA